MDITRLKQNESDVVMIADSVNTVGNRITSFLLNIPQIVVKELLRHRMFSFSSSSMRAIPFDKVLKHTRENIFIPMAFQAHHKGMQGEEYLAGDELDIAVKKWLMAAENACNDACTLYNHNVTKQLCSRIIEPFGYAKILITATEFDNFFNLRCPKYQLFALNKDFAKSKREWHDFMRYSSHPMALHNFETILDWLKIDSSSAEIHIQSIAEKMYDLLAEHKPNLLQPGEWHIPFGDQIDNNKIEEIVCPPPFDYKAGLIFNTKIKIATSRCARLSYMTFEGKIDYEKDLDLYNQLLNMKHASPMEHCAQAQNNNQFYANFKGFKSHRKFLEEENSL